MKILDVSLGFSFIFLWDNREYKIKRSYIRKFETGYSTRFSRDGINNRTEDRTKVNRERSEKRAKNRQAGQLSYSFTDTKCRGPARTLLNNESRSTFRAIKNAVTTLK